MNERIRELAEQAGLKVESWMTNPPKPFQILGSTEQFEKFAELIVRECCQYLGNEAERLYGLSASEVDPTFQSNFEICAEKCLDNSQGLKDHFGV